MSYILGISVTSPDFAVTQEDFYRFYGESFLSTDHPRFLKKLKYLSEKSRIITRHSVLPDFSGNGMELFAQNMYPPVEKRMEIYKDKIMPLARRSVQNILQETEVKTWEITHLITVSCTGLTAPGLEFRIADEFELHQAETISLNFLGCYAAIKAIKHANYITQANPRACVLIVCAELSSLHFIPSDSDEDITANLLFADGASSVIVAGKDNPHSRKKARLHIDDTGMARIPDTMGLMTWEITSSAFKMHLSREVVKAIHENVETAVDNFLGAHRDSIDHWAIHPGGVRIVEAVREKLNLPAESVADSMNILQRYGNMSSVTILFILNSIIRKINAAPYSDHKKIFACAFGPGLSIEMLRMSSVMPESIHSSALSEAHAA